MAAPAANAARPIESTTIVHIRLPSGAKATSVLSSSATCQGLGSWTRFSLEANPSTTERERLPGFRAAGVSRLSIGTQSFDDDTLRRVRVAVGELLGTGGAHGKGKSGRSARIALIGLRGAGKSTLGHMLGEDLHFPFIELSREIEQFAGCSIAEIQALYGQNAYRRYERRALEETIQLYQEAVIAIPGGGYHHLAWDKEGLDIAAWFAARGVAGFALAYRLPLDGWTGGLDTPLADAQRAVRVVRGRAVEFGIDPTRIAVIGFSAGGHLAANLAAQFDRTVYPRQDDFDQVSARPDLAAPIYPLVMADRIAAAAPAERPPFGKATPPEALTRHSPHLQARADAPPHFLVHAEDDPLLSPEHSLALRAALRAKAVQVETHLFAKGGHGFGIRNTAGLPVAAWPDRLLGFGRSTGWIT